MLWRLWRRWQLSLSSFSALLRRRASCVLGRQAGSCARLQCVQYRSFVPLSRLFKTFSNQLSAVFSSRKLCATTYTKATAGLARTLHARRGAGSTRHGRCAGCDCERARGAAVAQAPSLTVSSPPLSERAHRSLGYYYYYVYIYGGCAIYTYIIYAVFPPPARCR